MVSEPSDDFEKQLRKWVDRLSKPRAQALIRQVPREDIDKRVPDELRACVEVHDQEDGVLVYVEGSAAATTWLQELCNEDTTRILETLAANEKVGSGDGNDDPGDAG
jgi:hypothetical protein